MTELISPADLDRWEAMCKAATQRPLRVNRFDEEDGEITYQIQADDGTGYVLCSFGDVDNPRALHDAAFDVESRTAFPRLLAAYRELLTLNTELIGALLAANVTATFLQTGRILGKEATPVEYHDA